MVLGCVVLAVASCADAESPARTPKTAAEGAAGADATASPLPTPSATGTWGVADAGERIRAAATGRDAPGSHGLLVAAGSTDGALFVWETPDGRFCRGGAARTGATMVACAADPDSPPVGDAPRLVRLAATSATGWNVVFGAEHETVVSVSCDGVPVRVRDVGVMADGRRSVHALEFPDLTVGTVGVRVRRGSRVVTESLELHPFGKEDAGRSASCGKPTS
ncbi:hypothetical protein ACFQ8C_27760 [Streptomyces sp. NPDC056503]|uniref:hypothetical protein n=1 Tax=Streptomyces sp. NPDC056503 TaxID=3345842 RepID=UPI0036846C96